MRGGLNRLIGSKLRPWLESRGLAASATHGQYQPEGDAMLRIAIGWFGVLLGLLLVCAPATASVPETPRFRLLGIAEGMPSSNVVALARDRAGYLWIGTADGLARYDGVGFQVWRHVPGDATALPGNFVQAIHIDADDRIWVAIEGGGLSVLDADRRGFRHYRMSTHPQLGSDDIWSLAGRDGELWMGTYGGGLHRLDTQGNITRWSMASDSMAPGSMVSAGLPSDTILTLAFAADGVLWMGTDAGLARFDGNTIQAMPLPGEVPAPMVFSVTRDGDALWVGTAAGVFRRDPDGRWHKPVWSPMFERPNSMMGFSRERDGTFWIASQRGLWRVPPDTVPSPVALGGPGIAKLMPTLLLQDNGALWVPVAGVGLGYLRPDWRRVAQFARSPGGLSSEIYHAIATAPEGGVWLGGYNGEVERLDTDGGIERLGDAQRARLKGVRITGLVEDHDGRLWLGHRMGLIRVGRDGTVDEWGSEDTQDAVPSGQIDLLKIAPDGTLWLSAQGGGVQQRDPATGAVLASVPAGDDGGLGVGDTEALEFDRQGVPWIAGGDGLARWDGARKHFVAVAAMRGARVHAFAFDGRDALWLHRVSGLERYQRANRRWRRSDTVSPAAGLPAVESSGLRLDRDHRVWLSTPRGLLRWTPGKRLMRHFGVQDGLSSQEFLDRGLTLTRDGVLVASTADGSVVLIDTLVPDPAAVRPDLRTDSVAVRRKGSWQSLALDAAIELGQDEREFLVRTRLLAFDNPLSNRYWSRLQGFDRDWVAQGASGERVFTGLPSGDYVLYTRAVDAAGNASAENKMRFRVLPPWWYTPWARAGFFVLAIMLLWMVADAYRARLKRRHAMQLVEQKRALAEQASLAKTRFLATLGHEVRTPMTGVLGMTELLLGTPLEAKQRGYTESIRSAGNHLLRLVNDALDLARIESGKLELDAEPFVLRALIDEVVALMAPLARQKGLQFDATVGDDAPIALHGDAMRIRQILMNLLGNAIKFTRQGTVSLRVVALPPQSLPGIGLEGVRLEVGDTGPGLNDEQKARLFQRFEQAEGARTAARYGGSGLGLAISQELAAAMGGRIQVDSTPGQGARFTVDLPLATASITEVPSVAATLSGAVPALDLLLVEDDPTVAAVIAGLLRAQGHRVTHVAHGLAALVEVALVEAANARFDVGLLDLDLPGLDGLALARQLRAQGFSAPLLAVTARADAEAEPLARAAGFDGFLRKPLTGDMLAEAIQATLDKSTLR